MTSPDLSVTANVSLASSLAHNLETVATRSTPSITTFSEHVTAIVTNLFVKFVYELELPTGNGTESGARPPGPSCSVSCSSVASQGPQGHPWVTSSSVVVKTSFTTSGFAGLCVKPFLDFPDHLVGVRPSRWRILPSPSCMGRLHCDTGEFLFRPW